MVPIPSDRRWRRPRRVRCWACAQRVRPDARKCHWCGEWLDFGEPGGEDESETPITIELAADLARDKKLRRALGERLPHVARRINLELGVATPPIQIRELPRCGPGAYEIRLGGDLHAEGYAKAGHLLGIGQDLNLPEVEVEHAADPIYGTPAAWFPVSAADVAEQHGLQVFDVADVIGTHTAEVIKHNAAELMTRDSVAALLRVARTRSPMAVRELVPSQLTLGQVRNVLQNLLREQVPIKDLSTILNTLADHAGQTTDPAALTEHVRCALGRKICARYESPDGMLKAFMLSPDAERAVQNSIRRRDTGDVPALDPTTSQAIQNNLADALSRHRGQILDPVLITPPKIRPHVQQLLARNFSRIAVISYAEIVAGVQIDNLETIEAHSQTSESPFLDNDTTTQEPSTIVEAPDSDWLGGDTGKMSDTAESADDSADSNDAMDWNW